MIMVTKPAKLFSAELQVQYGMVQRKMANGMVQPISPVKMARSKTNAGTTEEKCNYSRNLITSSNYKLTKELLIHESTN